MMSRFIQIVAVLCLGFSLAMPTVAFAYVKGIYVTQSSAENTNKMRYFIREAKATGIDTFVIDVNRKSRQYAKNIAMVKNHGIRYVARVVVFPLGGTYNQVTSRAYWQKRWRQAEYAVALGADEIQLDYIRFKASRHSSSNNAKLINRVIRYFKEKLNGTGVKLQIDIFGVAAHKPSRTIGQNVPLFASNVDAICPMVYPSHYEPYRHHAVRPYSTLLKSVAALKRQLIDHPHVEVYAFIELYNYRYPMSYDKKMKYINAEMEGAHDAGADGWYAWSPNNQYRILFSVLRKRNGS